MKYTSTQIQQMLDSPGVKSRTALPVRINRSHDIPGLAAMSSDGRTVYIDKDLHVAHIHPVLRYAKLRKALVDLFRMHPDNAKEIATKTHLKPYAGVLLRFIKTIDSPLLKNIPPDLDFNIYRPNQAKRLIKKIKHAINRKELKVARVKIYNQIAKTLDKDKKKEYYKRLAGGRKQWI